VLVRAARATFAGVLLASSALGTACSALLSADPTPVPGAAATLTRAERTPIPTPVRTPAAAAAASAVASPSAGASASPSAVFRPLNEAEVAEVQARVQAAVATAALPDLESLLLDHVSLSTSDGGQVMDTSQTAAWLRDRASDTIKVTRVDRGSQSVMLQVLTQGWANRPPVDQGQLSFSLRRYDSNGRPDEENGDWKIDVITAD
jgi:hypothetical protein